MTSPTSGPNRPLQAQVGATPALLAMRNIHLRRGERELFNGLTLVLDAGDLVWLRGANGRGKTTLLRIAAGLISPERGQLLWRGLSYASRLDETPQALSYLDDRLGLSRDLSVRENLRYVAAMGSTVRVPALLDQLDLGALAERPVGLLSTGQKKRVALARLLIEQAPVWLLDEPANGLDTLNRQRLAAVMETHIAQGGACIYASHDELPFLRTMPRIVELDA